MENSRVNLELPVSGKAVTFPSLISNVVNHFIEGVNDFFSQSTNHKSHGEDRLNLWINRNSLCSVRRVKVKVITVVVIAYNKVIYKGLLKQIWASWLLWGWGARTCRPPQLCKYDVKTRSRWKMTMDWLGHFCHLVSLVMSDFMGKCHDFRIHGYEMKNSVIFCYLLILGSWFLQYLSKFSLSI